MNSSARLPLVFALCSFAVGLAGPLFGRGSEYRKRPGPLEPADTYVYVFPLVHLPVPPPEMRVAMDQSPVPPRYIGVVFGGYQDDNGAGWDQSLKFGVAEQLAFRFRWNMNWNLTEGWIPVMINWFEELKLPMEVQFRLDGRGEYLEVEGERTGHRNFSADYKW